MLSADRNSQTGTPAGGGRGRVCLQPPQSARLGGLIHRLEPDVVVDTCNVSTQEAKMKGPG